MKRPPENCESIKQNLPLALIDFEYAGVDLYVIEHLTHYQELSKINRRDNLELDLTNLLYINIYSCLLAADLLKAHKDIKYSGNGFTFSKNESTDIVTAANAWIDALCQVFNKNTKQSIYHSISPGKLFSLYLPKPAKDSTDDTNKTNSDQKQLQNNSLVGIGSHFNTQLPQNNNLTNKRKKFFFNYDSISTK